MESDRMRELFEAVGDYSHEVRRDHPERRTRNALDWSKEYLLAAHREVSDMLGVIPEWKPHRRKLQPHGLDLDALTEEGVDAINYVIATLKLFGVSETDFYRTWGDKMELLRQLRLQEVVNPIRPSQDVVMLDLDGVLADFRKGYIDYLREAAPETFGELSFPDPVQSLQLDIDLGLQPDFYRNTKKDFEERGGYSTLPVFDMAHSLVWEASFHGRVVFITSRPLQLRRVLRDSLSWIQNVLGFRKSNMVLLVERRKAEWLASTKANVKFCVEDDPTQIGRLYAQGYQVYVPAHGYNEGVDDGKEDRIFRSNLAQIVQEVSQGKFERGVRADRSPRP